MPDLSALSTAQTTALGLSNLILVTPEDTGYQPQNPSNNDGTTPPPPPKFLFDYEGDQSVRLSSDVTDHYIEDNTAIQDQVALRPVQVTTHGYIGELNDVAPAALQPLKIAANKLTVVGAYTPVLTTSAIIAYNTALAAYQTVSNLARNAVGAWDSINGGQVQTTIDGTTVRAGDNQNKQQVAFQKFFGYWSNRTMFTIQTPWAIFKNMIIMDLVAEQDAETRVVSSFEITFKQLRFASTILVNVTGGQSTYNQNNFQGRSFNQGSPITDLGTANLTEGPSLASFIA